MTAPAAGDGDLREQLAEAALAYIHDDVEAGCIADVLLPVVSRHADQRAAEELNSLANELHVLRFNGDDNPSHRWPTGTKREVDSFYGGIKRAYLRARARAARLDTQPTAPQEQP